MDAMFILSIAYEGCCKYEEAEACINHHLELCEYMYPDDKSKYVPSYVQLANICSKNDGVDYAEEILEQCLRDRLESDTVHADMVPIIKRLAELYKMNDKADAAEQLLTTHSERIAAANVTASNVV